MKAKNIVLIVVVCIIVLAVVGYNYSYSKSKDNHAQDVTAGLEDVNLKVEKLTQEVNDLKTDLNTLKTGGKDYTKEIQEIIKKQAQPQSEPKQSGTGLKVAVVDIQKVFQGCKKGTSYRKEAIADQDRIFSELDKLSKEIDAEKAGIKTLKEGSSDYMTTAKELFEKQADYQARQEFYKQQIELKDKLWTKEIYQDIVRIAGDIAKEKGLDLVFREDEVDFSETNSNELALAMRVQKVLYSGGCLDITDEITARLDAEK
jgi:Skp family chaperone for outer membrane proteins